MSTHVHRRHSYARLRQRAQATIEAMEETSQLLDRLQPEALTHCDAIVVYSARIWRETKGETYPKRLIEAVRRIAEETK